MKKILLGFFSILITGAIVAQTSVPVAFKSNEIKLNTGQKITVINSSTVEASLSMGMELNSTSTTENVLEVKNATDNNFLITNTTTKIKMDMTMMGQGINYDSEDKKKPTSDIELSMAEKLNKPVEVTLNKLTGEATLVNKKEDVKDDEAGGNPMQGLMTMFSETADDALVSGTFLIIPAGKKTGDKWSETTKAKDMSSTLNYTIKAINGSEATIGLEIISTLATTLEIQGMEMQFNNKTTTTGDVITDVNTNIVKKKNTVSKLKGSFQMMGQDMPITGKITTESIYQ